MTKEKSVQEIQEELKLCVCGNKPADYCLVGNAGVAVAVVCGKCGRQTPLYFDKQAAISAWNKGVEK